MFCAAVGDFRHSDRGAFDLEPGDYRLEMKYVPEGTGVGIAVSVGSVMVFAVIMLLRRRKKKGTFTTSLPEKC